jgi:hypothetical protein
VTPPRPRLFKPLLLGLGLLLTATGAGQPAQAAQAEPVVDRQLWDDRITESSGLARSTYSRPVLWTHNDSGDSARVFAIGGDGNTRAVVSLEGAGAADWEDMASGPGHSIWVADIGDNGWDRGHVSVYRFQEPAELESGSVSAVRYDFEYPDGARDAEAMMVRPKTGRIFIVSKVEGGGAVYRAPKRLSTSSVNTLKRVGSAPAVVTGGSFAPDGRSYALVTYTRTYVFTEIGGAARSETSKVNNSSQGESVEVGRGGKRLFLGQEGSNSPVYAVPYRVP